MTFGFQTYRSSVNWIGLAVNGGCLIKYSLVFASDILKSCALRDSMQAQHL